MKTVANKRVLASAQRGFRREIGEAYTALGRRIAGMILIYADGDGLIPLNRLSRVQAQTGNILTGFFVGLDGRSPFGEDGTTPLAEYPRILNKWLAMSSARMVVAQYKWMRKHVPDDIQEWLTRTPSRDVPIKEILADLTDEQIEALRLFRANPLAEYEMAHTWVDPNGYRLSDRIWRTSVKTRTQLDAMIADGVREGMSAVKLAKKVEQFLHPNRAKIRTNKPYGKDASYDAMRLARTEIARAGNQAAFISSYTNPYVDKIDVARSANGDPTCTVCPQHATIGIGGGRLREPYSVHSADLAPWHPHCMCYVLPVVTDSPQTVTENLRSIVEEAGEGLPAPLITALQPQGMLRQMLRESMYRDVAEFLAQSVGP